MTTPHLDIIRAWKDPEYRLSLSEADLAHLLENPAGSLKLAPFRRTFLVHHMPGSPPTSPSKQSSQRELSHGLCPIPVRSSVWWDTSAGTITPALDLMQFVIDHAVTRVPHLP
jgi:mersacidin/lichenicidin family type 2 lantibiotic